jgi:plastocyanin
MRIPALLLLLAVLVMAGCGGNGDDNGGGGGGNVVKITDDGFEPSTLTVSSGDTVTFENESSDDSWPASDASPWPS